MFEFPSPVKPRRRRRLVKAVVGTAVVGVLVAVTVAAGGYVWADRQIDAIPTFDEVTPAITGTDEATAITVASAPLQLTEAPKGTPVTYLVFSTGSAGLDSGDGERLGIGRDRAQMADGLTDTIMLFAVHPETGRAGVLSIPRDTWIPSRRDRINTVYNTGGPQALADTVTELTGVPVNHMVAVNFAGFADAIDVLGGIDVWVDGPARDTHTGFEVAASGCVHLDGPAALRYARSRHWEVNSGRGWRTDASASDFGRIARQQHILRAAAHRARDLRVLAQLPAFAEIAQKNLVIDRNLDVLGSLDVARRLAGSGAAPETWALSGPSVMISGKSVVQLDTKVTAEASAGIASILRGELLPAPPPAGDAPPVTDTTVADTTPATPAAPPTEPVCVR